MRLSWCKAIVFHHWPDELVVETQHLVKQFRVFDVVWLLVAIELHRVRHHLFLRYIFETQEFVFVLGNLTVLIKKPAWSSSSAHGARYCTIGNCCWPIYTAWSIWHQTFTFIFQVFKLRHDFAELSLSFVFLHALLADREHPLAVHEVRGARSSWKITVDALPVLLEVRLDVLQSVQSAHLTRFLLLSHRLWLGLRRWLPLLCIRWVLLSRIVSGRVKIWIVCKMSSVLTTNQVRIQISRGN